jgi:hypothetical protein
LENERTVAAERTRLLEKKLQRELEHEREAAIERTRVLDERLQRESEIARTAASRNEALKEEIFKLQEFVRSLKNYQLVTPPPLRTTIYLLLDLDFRELEHGRADNQALMSDILEKSEELATLTYYSNLLESEKTCKSSSSLNPSYLCHELNLNHLSFFLDLENQVDHLNEELKCTRKEHAAYVRKVLDAARAIPNDLEPINSATPMLCRDRGARRGSVSQPQAGHG